LTAFGASAFAARGVPRDAIVHGHRCGFFADGAIDRNTLIALCLQFAGATHPMSKPVKPEQAPTFESALAELESIVTRMEGGQLSLELSLNAYKRGAELLKFCQAQLADAEQQVKVLEAGTLKNFAGADDDDND
jgi:exodeoxyribonuclease VII small subunit